VIFLQVNYRDVNIIFPYFSRCAENERGTPPKKEKTDRYGKRSAGDKEHDFSSNLQGTKTLSDAA
jgi:hypothetical protein